MTTQEAFEKYKHLDENLSDRDLLPDSFWGSIIYDLWSTVKDTSGDRISKEYRESHLKGKWPGRRMGD